MLALTCLMEITISSALSMDNFNFNSTRSKLQYPGYLYCKVHLNSSSLSNKKKPSHEVVYKVYDYNIEIHATKYKKLIFFFHIQSNCLFDSIQTIANPGESTSPAYSCTYINMTLKRQ